MNQTILQAQDLKSHSGWVNLMSGWIDLFKSLQFRNQSTKKTRF